MWETHLSIVDWVDFKIQTLQEILKTRNPLLEEHCSFLEVIHLFQEVGCARNKPSADMVPLQDAYSQVT